MSEYGITGGHVCSENFHVYPTTYAGHPDYAAEYFSRCVCGKKRKITTVQEVDASVIDLRLGGLDDLKKGTNTSQSQSSTKSEGEL